MKHKHHIVPKHMGGSDDPSNLVELTREEHANEHLKLYEIHGKKEDLGAYYLLTGQTDKAALVSCSLGGKVQGKKNAESGHMKRIAQLPNERNSGAKWITNGTVSKTIKPHEQLPEGYYYGRFCPRKEKKIY